MISELEVMISELEVMEIQIKEISKQEFEMNEYGVWVNNSSVELSLNFEQLFESKKIKFTRTYQRQLECIVLKN